MTKKPLAKSRIDPFKVRATSEAKPAAADIVQPPDHIAKAVDAFREANDQAKHFKGEATVYRDTVFGFAKGEYARRAMHGKPGSFKILGEETTVMFIPVDAGGGLTEEEVATLAAELGPEGGMKAESLLRKDYNSIRFDPEVLEKNYEAVVGALQGLPESILNSLFLPTTMVAVKGAGEMLRAHAKDAAQYERLLELCKIITYIKGG